MKRKLIKQGIGGYTIYLPKKWIDANSLSEKDSVDIDMTADGLHIKAKGKKRKEYTIQLHDENTHDIKQFLTHLYRNGADTINIEDVTPALVKKIQQLNDKLLLGFEVTYNAGGKMILENISEPSDEKFNSILRRVFLIIKETHALIKEDFETQKFEHKSAIEELRHQQDKLIIYCRRTLVKLQQKHNPILMWELLTFLMHIMHAYYYLYKVMHDVKVKNKEDIIQLLDGLEVYYDLFYNAYFKQDVAFIHKINSMKNKFQFGMCYDVLKKVSKDEAVIVSHIREIFRWIQLGTSPMFSQTFEREWAEKHKK